MSDHNKNPIKENDAELKRKKELDKILRENETRLELEAKRRKKRKSARVSPTHSMLWDENVTQQDEDPVLLFAQKMIPAKSKSNSKDRADLIARQQVEEAMGMEPTSSRNSKSFQESDPSEEHEIEKDNEGEEVDIEIVVPKIKKDKNAKRKFKRWPK